MAESELDSDADFNLTSDPEAVEFEELLKEVRAVAIERHEVTWALRDARKEGSGASPEEMRMLVAKFDALTARLDELHSTLRRVARSHDMMGELNDWVLSELYALRSVH